MRLVRNLIAWIAVTAVIITMAPIVMLIYILANAVALPVGGFLLIAYAIVGGLPASAESSERWIVLNTRTTGLLGIITGVPAIVMSNAIEKAYSLSRN